MAGRERTGPHRGAVCVAVAATVGLVAMAVPVTGARAVEPPTRARLTISISTTSKSTEVKIRPVLRLAERRTSLHGGRSASTAEGWSLDRSPLFSTATLKMDVVLAEAGSVPRFDFIIEKGFIGTTTLKVTNTTTPGQPFTVVEAVNSGHEVLSDNTTTVSRSRSEVFGAADLVLPKAESRRLVLAAYYPWFWVGAYDDILLADRPVNRRSTYDAADVLSMTEQARSHGVDGFLVSWAGAASDGAGFDLALEAAGVTAGYVTPYLETARASADFASPPDPVLVERWLKEALDRSANPAFLRSGGTPVVFVYSMALLPPETWASILAAVAAQGRAVRLVGDAPVGSYGDVSWGWHQYTANAALESLREASWFHAGMLRAEAVLHRDSSPRLYVGTVSPGYDDQALRGDTNPIVPRGAQGERYSGTWLSVLYGDPDWILVTSWNEWFEGTHIEPGVETGDLALRQTATEGYAWKTS